MDNFMGIDATTGIVLFILAVVIAAGISGGSSSRNAQKSREEWRALPDDQRAAHGMVGNSPSHGAVALGIIVILVFAYIMVKGSM